MTRAGSESSVRLRIAGESERGVVVRLLDAYLAELAQHRDRPVGASSASEYAYLDTYWSEPGREAVLIEGGGEIAGFAFVRGPESIGWDLRQMAEFYILPGHRRRGLGRAAVEQLWRRFPGAWELQVHRRNTAAFRFWSRCVGAAAIKPPRVTEVWELDGRRHQFDFVVRAGGPQR